jgi:hypothetical protein
MAAPKGHPRYGGRGKGAKNKATLAREQAIAEATARLCEVLTPDGSAAVDIAKLQPLDVLLLVMRRSMLDGDRACAIQCAGLAAPYVHARLSASEVRVMHGLTNLPDTELQAEVERLQRKLLPAPTIEAIAGQAD